jgi:hypothetical protein
MKLFVSYTLWPFCHRGKMVRYAYNRRLGGSPESNWVFWRKYKSLWRYKAKYLRHRTKRISKGMPQIMLNYISDGRRRLGRSLKRLLDEAGTVLLRTNSWRMMMIKLLAMLWTESRLVGCANRSLINVLNLSSHPLRIVAWRKNLKKY